MLPEEIVIGGSRCESIEADLTDVRQPAYFPAWLRENMFDWSCCVMLSAITWCKKPTLIEGHPLPRRKLGSSIMESPTANITTRCGFFHRTNDSLNLFLGLRLASISARTAHLKQISCGLWALCNDWSGSSAKVTATPLGFSLSVRLQEVNVNQHVSSHVTRSTQQLPHHSARIGLVTNAKLLRPNIKIIKKGRKKRKKKRL